MLPPEELKEKVVSEPLALLATNSPRRWEVFEALRIPYEIFPPYEDEPPLEQGRDPATQAEARALAKAQEVAEETGWGWVIGADTIVVADGDLLGKPRDAAEAEAMLKRLRGREHRVITGVAVVNARTAEIYTAHEVTTVNMRNYSDEEIRRYIQRGEPFDKAGAYAIQDPLFRPVASWDGCYLNVVGLPLCSAAVGLRNLLLFWMPGAMELPPQCITCPRRDTLDCSKPLPE